MPEHELLDPRQKPDLLALQREMEHLQRVWQDAHLLMKEADSYYFQSYDLWGDLRKTEPQAAENRPQFHSGRAPAIVDHAVDVHLAFEPTFHRRPLGAGEEQTARADRLEEGLQQLFRDALLKQTDFAPKVNGKQLALYSYTQLYVGLDDLAMERPTRQDGETQEEFEEREEEWSRAQVGDWNPLKIVVPVPGTVLMDPNRKTPQIAIVKHKLWAYELQRRMEQKRKRRGAEVNEWIGPSEPHDEVEVVEVWSPYWTALLEAGTGYEGRGTRNKGFLWVEENDWGFQPYLHAFVGSVTTPTGEAINPKWWVQQSLLFKVSDGLRMWDQWMWAKHQLVMRAATAKTLYAGDAAEAAQKLEGDIVPETRVEDWGIEKTPELPNQMEVHGRQISEDIEQATYSLQAAGFRQEGVTTVGQQVLLSEATNRTFRATVSQMEQLYSAGASNALKLRMSLARDYPDWGVVIGGSPLLATDIQGRYHIEVKFEQIDPAVALQEKQGAMKELELGLIDSEEYYRITRRKNVTALRKGILKDRLRQTPKVAAEMETEALKELGLIEMAERRRKAAQQSGGTVPAPFGVVPTSNGRTVSS